MNKTSAMLPQKLVNINDLKVDYTYQRPLDEKRVSALVEQFDMKKVRIPVVSIRANGDAYILDGNNTTEILKRVGVTGAIHVQYHVGLTIEQEAKEFHELNRMGRQGRLPVPVIYRFNSAVVAKDPTELAIKRTVDSLRIPFGPNERNGIRSIEALYYAHRNKNLAQTLRTLNAWCPEDKRRFENALIRGVSAFYSEFPNADESFLVSALQRSGLGPMELKARFARNRNLFGVQGVSYLGHIEAILEIYNKGRKSSRALRKVSQER